MSPEWDEAERASNIAKHGVDFSAIEAFEWESALVRADTRLNYGEVRLAAIGLIGNRFHVLIYTVERRAVRVISLRSANRKEIRAYVDEIAPKEPSETVPLADG